MSGVRPNPDQARFLYDVAHLWGKKISTKSRIVAKIERKDILEFTYVFGEIPFVVFGVRGLGNDKTEADASAGNNLLSIMRNYISSESAELIDKRWWKARAQVAEVVEVCKVFERILKTDEFSSLRGIEQFAILVTVHSHLINRIPETVKWNCANQSSSRSGVNPDVGQAPPIPRKKDKMSVEPSRTSEKTKPVNKKRIRDDDTTGSEGSGHQRKQKKTGRTVKTEVPDNVTESTQGNPPGPSQEMNSMVSPERENNDMRPSHKFGQEKDKMSLAVATENSCDVAKKHKTQETLPEPSFSVARVKLEPELVEHVFEKQMPLLTDSEVRPIVESQSIVDGLEYQVPPPPPEEPSAGMLMLAWCIGNNKSPDYERWLLGVEFAGSEVLSHRVHSYICQYRQQCSLMDDGIWQHFHTNKQSQDEYERKMAIRNVLLGYLESLAFPMHEISLAMVGASINGCGTSNPNMELCLCVPDIGTDDDYQTSKTAALHSLNRLQRLMMSHEGFQPLVQHALVIPEVPVMRLLLKKPYHRLQVGISINNISAVYSSHLIYHYSRLDERFPCLVLLLNNWTISNGLYGSVNGALDSYSLTLLVLHYLQCGVQPAVLPNLTHLFPGQMGSRVPLRQLQFGEDVGRIPDRFINPAMCSELLIGFFHYYASFEFSQFAISVGNAGRFRRFTKLDDSSHYAMYLEEPYGGKNAAKSVTKSGLELIENAFKTAAMALSSTSPDLARIGIHI